MQEILRKKNVNRVKFLDNQIIYIIDNQIILSKLLTNPALINCDHHSIVFIEGSHRDRHYYDRD